MIIKEYDLSRVSDEICEKLFHLALDCEFAYTPEIFRFTDAIKMIAIINGIKYNFVIRKDGDIALNQYPLRFMRVWYIQEIINTLQETQWIDPNEYLPEEGQKVVVKTTGEDGICITTLLYTADSVEWHCGFVHDSLGWMSADNVVL